MRFGVVHVSRRRAICDSHLINKLHYRLMRSDPKAAPTFCNHKFNLTFQADQCYDQTHLKPEHLVVLLCPVLVLYSHIYIYRIIWLLVWSVLSAPFQKYAMELETIFCRTSSPDRTLWIKKLNTTSKQTRKLKCINNEVQKSIASWLWPSFGGKESQKVDHPKRRMCIDLLFECLTFSHSTKLNPIWVRLQEQETTRGQIDL